MEGTPEKKGQASHVDAVEQVVESKPKKLKKDRKEQAGK
jgi:hypothetical protein